MDYIDRWAEKYNRGVPPPLANHADAMFKNIKLLEATGKSVGGKAEARRKMSEETRVRKETEMKDDGHMRRPPVVRTAQQRARAVTGTYAWDDESTALSGLKQQMKGAGAHPGKVLAMLHLPSGLQVSR